MDTPPVDANVVLLEKGETDLVLTGDRENLLKLVGITSRISEQLVIEGSWRSADNIQVRISSALVAPEKAKRLARRLIREDPLMVWVPWYAESYTGDEYLRVDRKSGLTPWIVHPSREAKLDEHDPFGASCALLRPRISRDFTRALSLTTDDPFGRTWLDRRNRVAALGQAWGRDRKDSDRGPYSGLRLLCSASAIKDLLERLNKEILLLIHLELYESKSYLNAGRFVHTVAVVRVTKAPDFEYVQGAASRVQESRF